ncbi:unnamed protein product [Soboliphyme baturini]|uniref:Amino acid transporter n=1 Tax=Soboliphyme baturini TaxID=241478 RepID=A0A183JB99_9BILA|nr:unnamed protein product [Soboliphyme baturini]
MGLKFSRTLLQSGQFWVTLVDNFGAGGIPLIFIVFFESIALSFGFGTIQSFGRAKRIHDALSEMLGYSPSLYWYYCWRYVVPALLLALFVFVVVLFKPLLYADNVPYAPWATILGILMSVSSMIAVPAYAVYFLCTAQKGTLRQVTTSGAGREFVF